MGTDLPRVSDGWGDFEAQLYQEKLESTVMVQICAQCSRLNPPEASYCYYDAVVLQGRVGPEGPLHPGSRLFPTPFVFPSGAACCNFDQLAQECQKNWKEARDLLQQGLVEPFLGGLGRADLALAARAAAAFPDPDRGLDQLLAKLPTTALAPPKLAVEPTQVDFGPVQVGYDYRLDVRLINQGLRLLYGSVVSDCEWLAPGESRGSLQKLFQFSTETTVPVFIRGQYLRAGPIPLEGRGQWPPCRLKSRCRTGRGKCSRAWYA